MRDQKLFRIAEGRKFQIQAVDRHSGATEVLRKNLTQADCEDYTPSRLDKQCYKNFRIAFHDKH